MFVAGAMTESPLSSDVPLLELSAYRSSTNVLLTPALSKLFSFVMKDVLYRRT